jgi:hypothetical protein
MDFSVTNRSIPTQSITAYQKSEGEKIPFVMAGLNICLPNTSQEEVAKIVKDNFRSEKDRVLEKDAKYFILMKGTTIEAGERALNRLKAKLGFISRNFRCLKDSKPIQADAYILGTSRKAKKHKCKYVDLTPVLNFVSKETHRQTFGFKEYLKYSIAPKGANHSDDSTVNILA